MTTKDNMDMMNKLEERIENLEHKYAGFTSNMIVVLTYLLPETPETIKLRKEHLSKLKILLRDRDFNFEKEKTIQKFLEDMKDFI